jgi:long-chain acyl-CoA synthetase
MLTSDALRIRAESQPERIIFQCGPDSLTYLDWHRRSSAAARGLVVLGVRQQECVLLTFNQNQWINYVIALLAVQKAGAIAVPLPEGLPKSMADKIAAITRARYAVGSRYSVGDMGIPGVRELSHPELMCDGNTQEDFQVPVTPDQVAEIIMTSGTTGDPKLVACPHGNLAWETLSPEAAARRYGNEVVPHLSASLMGTNGAQRLVSNALRGTPFVYYLLPSFEPAEAARLIREMEISELTLVPVQATALLRYCEGISFERVVQIHLGSAHTPAWVANGLAALFPHAEILNKYGLTEGGQIRLRGRYDATRPGWIGHPRDGHSVRITDNDGHELPARTQGMLWVRDSAPNQRYYYGDESSSESPSSADGWISTGDIALMGDDGSVTLIGRTKDIANVGGLKVPLKDVDEAVAAMGGVLDCGAFVLPHRTVGDLICMAIVLEPGADTEIEEGKARIARQLGSWAPRFWTVVTEIPRTLTGKIRREFLADLARTEEPGLANFYDNDLKLTTAEIEAMLIGEFQRILKIENVNQHSNFFACGGDSLTVIELIEHLESDLGITSGLDELPVWSSIAEMAAWLHDLLASARGKGSH